jgi:hypothetical protein
MCNGMKQERKYEFTAVVQGVREPAADTCAADKEIPSDVTEMLPS